MPDHGMGAVQAHDTHRRLAAIAINMESRQVTRSLTCAVNYSATLTRIAQPIATLKPERAPALLFAVAGVAVPSLVPRLIRPATDSLSNSRREISPSVSPRSGLTLLLLISPDERFGP